MPVRSKPRSSSSADGATWPHKAFGESATLLGVAMLSIAVSGQAASRGDPIDDTLRLAAAIGAAAASGDSELLLLVDVNRQGFTDTVVVLRRSDGGFWVSAESLERWRLRVPPAPPHLHAGVAHYPLAAIVGVALDYDAAGQRLSITAPPDAFVPSSLARDTSRHPPPALPTLGGFFNYSVFASSAAGESDFAGQVEAGIFGRHGVVTNSVLAQHADHMRGVVRLDTTYTLDAPERMETLRIGDAISFAGTWGRAVRFGGVQFGTNFATQPGFVTVPTIVASGQAALPSTVDVFVNNALVAQRPVPPGPFSITNIPTVSGSGNVHLVVRDLFGREQLISQSFYAGAEMLKPGLALYSLEAGLEREDFGIASASYGRAFASGTYRRGLSRDLTAEVRAEAMRDRAAMGVAATHILDEVGIVRGVAAASRAGGAGALLGAGFERNTGIASVSVQAQWTSPDFRIVGVTADNPLPRWQASATLGAQLGAHGSASLTWIGQSFRDAADVRVLSGGYSVALGRLGFLSLAVVKSFGAGGDIAVSATVTVPWSTRDWVSAGHTLVRGGSGDDRQSTSLSLQRNLPAGEGFGYRVLARTREVQASAAYQGNVATYSVDATRFEGENAVRANVAGGVGFLGGHAFASRAITESFGIVRVDDYGGVGVTADNQLVARTNAGGYAVLPRLRAYDANTIGIVQQDLPLDAEVDRLSVQAVPYFRSGVMLDFPIRRSRGATLRIKLDDGGDIPAGALVDRVGGASGFPVAFDGEVYVTGLATTNRLRATWKGRSCEFDVPMEKTRDPLPHLGTYVCGGVAR